MHPGYTAVKDAHYVRYECDWLSRVYYYVSNSLVGTRMVRSIAKSDEFDNFVLLSVILVLSARSELSTNITGFATSEKLDSLSLRFVFSASYFNELLDSLHY